LLSNEIVFRQMRLYEPVPLLAILQCMIVFISLLELKLMEAKRPLISWLVSPARDAFSCCDLAHRLRSRCRL
jgi:hypothetical protein